VNARTKPLECQEKTGAGGLKPHGEVKWVTEAADICPQREGPGGGGGRGPTDALNASLTPQPTYPG
jgi:hypothetical protein